MEPRIPNETTVQLIHYEPEFTVICSVSDIPFHGTIEIEYKPEAYLLEFEGFETWLKEQSSRKFTIESFCQFIFDNLTRWLEEVPLRVSVHAETIVHAPATATIERKH